MVRINRVSSACYDNYSPTFQMIPLVEQWDIRVNLVLQQYSLQRPLDLAQEKRLEQHPKAR